MRTSPENSLEVKSKKTASMDNQQGATVWHMELHSVLCGSLEGRGIWERIDTCICTAESLRCSPAAVIALLIGYTPMQNKKLKK